MRKFASIIAKAESSVAGINRRNIDLIYPNNPRNEFRIADDKALFKGTLSGQGVPVPSTYTIIEHLWEVDRKLDQLERHEDVVIKPSRGSGGNGILILRKNQKGWVTPDGTRVCRDQLRMHIATILYGAFSHDKADIAIAEERLVPDAFLLSIYEQGIPDVRIIMHHDVPIMAMLRIPTRRSRGKANLHQGALGIGIDTDSGVLGKGVFKGKLTAIHPDSGVRFTGMTMPRWDDFLRISRHTASLVPLKFLGIDLILDARRGPLVIEINARPGLQIQNANQLGLLEALQKTGGNSR